MEKKHLASRMKYHLPPDTKNKRAKRRRLEKNGNIESLPPPDTKNKRAKRRRLEKNGNIESLPPPDTKNKRAKRRRLEKNGNIESLPSDILMNIFLRFPATYLLNTIGCVCRSWREIIRDPGFIRDQLSSSNSSLIFQANDRQEEDFIDTISLKINLGPWNTATILSKHHRQASPKIKATCNGLLLILLGEDDLRVGNPITHQWLKLPEIGLDFTKWLSVAGFGFTDDRSTNEYKVVCSYLQLNFFRCAIHTVGSVSWKEIEMPYNNNIRIGCLQPISVGDGTLHWMTLKKRKGTELYEWRKGTELNECCTSLILSLEVSGEKFRITRDPPDNDIVYVNSDLMDLGGSLALFHYVSRPKRQFNVWVLEDYEKQVWVRRPCINITDRREMSLLHGARPFASLQKGEVVMFMGNYGRLFSYDLKLNKLMQVKAHFRRVKRFNPYTISHPFPHTDSLVAL